MRRQLQQCEPGTRSKQLWRAALLASTCVSGIAIAMPVHAQSLPANTTPQGGVVAGGSASITQAPDLTTINQSSQKAIIDWQTFNVGSAATVDFNQPSANAVALNRVITPSPSIIAGKIDANGQLIIINQSGVIFTKGSEVDAQSLVATTSEVSDKDFLAGKLNFTGAPRPGASIVNDGNITVKDTGLVGLIAPQVANNGVITAQLGQVVLAGASAFTLDLYGDRLMSIDVTQAVRAVDVGGKLVPALVTNSGVILADGGKITLTAQDADALVTQLINAGGTIRANSVGANTGTIAITGVGGNISIAGNLLAQGVQTGSKGGAVEVLTDGTVAVNAGATINTSGDAGGGVIALGTDISRTRQGAADTAAPRARAVLIAPGAVLLSDATGTGNGGDVTLLSTNFTNFAGAIYIQGGPNGGNGGVAEISSGNVINLSGTVADTAIGGQSGEILLDPATLIVGSGTVTAGSVVSGSTATFGTDSSTTSYISPSVLDTLTGTIVLQATSLISITDAVSITGAGSVLTIASGGDVTVGNSIYVNGSLEIDAAGSLAIDGGLSASDILLSSGTAGTNIDAAVSATNILALASLGNISENSAGSIDAVILTSGGVNDGQVNLALSNFLGISSNQIGTLGNFSASSLNLGDDSSLSVAGPVVATGNITLTAGNIDIAGSISSANLSLFSSSLPDQSTGSITESTGAISTGTFSGTALDSIILNGSDNSIATLGDVTAGDGNSGSSNELVLSTTGTLNVAGTVSAMGYPSGDIILSAASINISGSLSSSTLTLDSTSDITESTGAISTGTLSGSASGNVTLSGTSNSISTLGNVSAHNFILSNSGALNVTGPVIATGDVALSADGINFKGSLSSADLSLTSNGDITEPTGAISTGTLSGSASGSISLGGSSNNIAALGSLSASSLLLTNTGSLSVTGPVDTTYSITLGAVGIDIAGSVTSNYLYLNGNNSAISESTGVINTSTLVAVSIGDITLGNTTNQIGTLGNISAGTSDAVSLSNIVLTSSGSLSVAGPVYATGNITLNADGIGLAGGVTSANLYLDSAGTISESTGYINTGSLAGTASADVVLDGGNNTITALGSFTSANFSLNDNGDLSVAGPLVATGSISLNNPAGSIDIAGTISSASLDLYAYNNINESTGVITTGTLSAGSAGSILLDNPTNSISSLGNISAASFFGGDLVLANSGSLSIAGPVTVYGGNATISADSIDIAGSINSANLSLNSTGDITESTGTIVTGTLTGNAGGNVTLTGGGNSITAIGSFAAGNFALTNSGSLSVTGPVAASGNMTLDAAGIDFAGSLSSADLYLISSASVSESTGNISTGTLAGSIAGGLSLTSAYNSINSLGDITLGNSGTFDLVNISPLSIIGSVTGGNINLSDFTALTISGTGVLSGSDVTLSSSDLDIFGTLAASGLLALATSSSSETILEASTATVLAGTLASNVVNIGSLYLDGTTNNIGTLDGFNAADFRLFDAGSLEITGAITSGRNIILNDTTTISIDAALTAAPLDTVVLVANAMDFGGGATITAPGGNILIAPYGATTPIAFGGTTQGALDLTPAALGNFSAATLIVGTADFYTASGTTNSIAISGDVSLGTSVSELELIAGGPVTQSGSLSADNISISGTTITLGGTVDAAGDVTLSSDGIALQGSLTSANLSLNSSGDIDQPGGMISTGTLSGTASGNVTLSSTSNLITALGNFSAHHFALSNSGALDITGSLTAPGGIDLQTNGNITETTGVIDTGTLTAIALDGDILFGNTANNISVLSTISGDQLTLFDTSSLSVAGPVGIIGNATITAAGLDFAGSISSANLSLVSTGNITESTGTITTGTLTGNSTGTVTLGTTGNQISTVGSFSANDFALSDDEFLSVTGPLHAANFINLSATGIDIAGSIYGASLNLDSTGAVTESTGVISIGSLTGEVLGNATINNAANSIATLGSFSADNFSLTDAGSLTVTGPVNTNGNVNLTAAGIDVAGSLSSTNLLLSSSSTISESTGAISTGTLTGSASGNFNLESNHNSIAALGSISAGSPSSNGVGAFVLTNTGSLTVLGPVYAASSISLTTDGLDIAGLISAPRLTLNSAAGITESAGTIDTGNLSGSAIGNVTLNGPNSISSLDGFPANNFSLVDDTALSIVGSLSATQTINLSASSIDVAGDITATSLYLDSTGNITESTGTLNVGSLSGMTGGNVTLDGTSNNVATLGDFSADNFYLADHGTLTIAGPVSATNSISLTAGSIDVTGSVTAADIYLASLGNISEPAGAIDTGTLYGSAAGNVSFGSATNVIRTLGSFGAANFELKDAGTLNVGGPLNATGNVTLNAGNIDIAGSVSSANLSLFSAGSITESTGVIQTGTFGGSAAGSIILSNASNHITALGSLSAFSLLLDDSDSLNIAGTVFAIGNITLNAGNIDFTGSVGSADLSVDSSGFITQSSGAITTGSLSAIAVDGIDFGNAGNKIATIGNIAAGSAANATAASFILTNSGSLSVIGPVTATGNIILSSDGLDIAGLISGANISVASSGDISESTGSIKAGTLSGSASGNVALSSSGNSITALGRFTAGNFVLSNNGALDVTGPVIATGNAALTAAGIIISGSLSAANLSLASTGNIIETSGAVTAGTLTGYTNGNFTLDADNNSIANLGSISAGSIGNVAAGNFALSSTGLLNVMGPVTALGDIALTAAGIELAGNLSGSALYLDSTSGITQTNGVINTGSLTGTAAGNVTLTSSGNSITALGSFSAHDFALTNSGSLSVTGPVNAMGNVTFAADGIDIAGSLASANLSLASTGAITESTGTINTGTLSGSASGNLTLGGNHNSIAAIGNFIADNFALRDSGPLNILGSLITTNDVSIAAAGIAVTGSINSATLEFASSGDISEPTGAITTGTLSGYADGNVTLTDAGNNITTLGSFTAGSGFASTGHIAGGNFALSNSGSLTIGGPVIAYQNISVSTAGLIISGALSAKSINLMSSADINETTGTIDTGTLSGSAFGSASFTEPNNKVGTLGSFSASQFALADTGSLNVSGFLDVTNNIDLSATSIGLTGSIAGSALYLASQGDITETGGNLNIGTLTGTAAGNVLLGSSGNSIGILGSFSAANFGLYDAVALDATGPVSATNTIAIAANGINLAGSLTSALLNLDGGDSSISQSAGVIHTGTLTGNNSGNVTLNAAGNDIATLGSFSAAHLALTDAASLNVVGSLSASDVTLTLPSVGFNGDVSISGALVLEGLSNGAAQGSGNIIAGTLAGIGSLGGDILLTLANDISTLGGFALSSNNLDITDAVPLTIAGAILARNATLSATSIDLTGSLLTSNDLTLINEGTGGITLAGLASAGSVLSLSSDGGISETGSLVAATLTGNATNGDVALSSNHNQIGTLDAFSATGNDLSLNDQSGLTLAGPVLVNTATIVASSLDVTGGVTTNAELLLSGSSLIALNGVIDAGTILTLQSPGSITETGTIIAAGLSSSDITDGNVILDSSHNSIGGISTLTSDGTFSLIDQVILGISNLTANDVTLVGPGINFTGNVAATDLLALNSPGNITQSNGSIITALLTSDGTADGDVNLIQPGNNIASLGSFSATSLEILNAGSLSVNGPVNVTSASLSADGINLAGSLTATELYLAGLGTINQSAGALNIGTLTGTIAGGINLTSNSNSITTLGSFTSNGNFNLNDTGLLTITGPFTTANTTLSSDGLAMNGTVQTGALQVASAGDVTESGIIDAATLTTGSTTISGSVSLDNANSIATLGNFAATGDVSLYDAQSLSLAGIIVTPSTLTLGDAGSIIQTGGLISSGALVSDGTIGGDISLTAAGNSIPVLGSFAATGNITLNDSSALSLQGNINAGTLGLYSAGTLSQSSGTITTGLFNAAATSIRLGDSNSIASLGSVTTPGSLNVNGVDGISGTVNAQNANLVSTGSFAFNGNTSIANNLTVTAVGDITQDSGSLTAQNVTLAATQSDDSISLSGTDLIAQNLNFATYGNVLHNAGTLDAGTLTGTAGSLASFAALTDIGTIGSFLMGDSLFTLNNAGMLTITGPLVANVISITANGQLILSGSPTGGLFFSGSEASDTATAPRNGIDSVLSVTGANPTITETGIFYINDGPSSARFNSVKFLGTTNLSASIFFLTAQSPNDPGGNVMFDVPANALTGPSIDVIIDAGNNGVVSGNVDLYHLEIIRALNANLTGSIDGVSGQPASGKASATMPSSKDQIKACPIGSVDCVILFIESLPNGNPLGDFDITERKRRRLDKNVQLPGIAMHDF